MKWTKKSSLMLSGFILAWSTAPALAQMSMDQPPAAKTLQQAEKGAVYTCPMHPQIRQPNPGRCPICGMELVLAEHEHEASQSEDDQSISITPATRRLAGIKTGEVKATALNKVIKAVGTLTFDESKLATIPAYIDGRIEELYADYTGVAVQKGDSLAVLYSPSLFSAQVEYLQSRKTLSRMSGGGISSVQETQSELMENSRTKLLELGMSENQVAQIGKSGKAKSRLEIFSPIAGTVIEKPASRGQYLKAGQTIFKIADLTTVWLMIDVFPEDASKIHYGQKVEAKVRSVPGKTFTGRVAFVSPVVNPLTRTIGVRVEIVNEKGQLRPGDYAEAEMTVSLAADGGSSKIYDPELVGKYISPMHPQNISDKPGKCPVCGMDLVPSEKFGFSETPTEEKVIAVPRDAVLQVGKTSVVFVENTKGTFSLREVQTGPSAGNSIVIVSGLEESETIAVDGVFLLDSQMQLSGKTSLIDVSNSAKNQTKSEAEQPN